MRSVIEGQNQADGTFVCMSQRQHREENVLLIDHIELINHRKLRAKVVVGKHYTLWLRCRTRSVDNRGQIVALRNTLLTITTLDILRNDTEIFGADYDIEALGRLFRNL